MTKQFYQYFCLVCLLLATLTACGLHTSARNNALPPSEQHETAATLLNMLQIYRSLSAEQQTHYLQAITSQYEHQASADNTLRLALLLSVPKTQGKDFDRARRLLEHLLNIPWALRADALNLAQLRYQQVQHLLACQELQSTLNTKDSKLAALQQQVDSLQKKIDALTKIEKTVDSPLKTPY